MLERIHLTIIETLHRTGSLTDAALELNLTQSALTHSIKKLERLSGVSIWEKKGRGLRLTEAGLVLLQNASRMLPQFEDIENQLTDYAQGRSGTLRIGVECHPCFEWIVKIVQKYLMEWPSVDLDVTRDFQFGGLDALENRKINMLISPDKLKSDRVLHFDILDFELQLMVNSGHRLCSVPYVKPEDFDGEVLFTYPVPVSRLDVFKLDINPLRHIPVEAAEIMVQFVAAGRGVSTFPDWMIRRYSESSDVKGISLTEKGIRKKLYLIIRKEDRDVPFIKSFISLSMLLKEGK